MSNKTLIFINSGVCSSWGRRLPKHIFKTQYAPVRGHRYCLNCGMTLSEAREEERLNKQGSLIETRIIDFHSEDLEHPIYLTKENIRKKEYRSFL